MSSGSPPSKKSKQCDIAESLTESRKTCAKSVVEFCDEPKFAKTFKKRVRTLCEGSNTNGGVLYWMYRDQRVQDNWALLHAQATAIERDSALHVAIAVPPTDGERTIRHATFQLEGLKEVERELCELNISFHLLAGHPDQVINQNFLASLNVGLVVADFSPLRHHKAWLSALQTSCEGNKNVTLQQVDAHNIVPVWVASDKQEYTARTIRPKIEKKLSEFLTSFPSVVSHPVKAKSSVPADFTKVYDSLKVDREGWGVNAVEKYFPHGTKAGLDNLQTFVHSRLKMFAKNRNNPNYSALSKMSPWINQGQVSMQRCILYIKENGKSHSESLAAYIEEGVIRRELSDNFCYYNDNYDSLKGASQWAQTTLNDHRNDERDYVYTREQLETGKTHDDLWNAAQLQLVCEGKMHGFLRMYWAKKVLEWTASPEVALREALRLNDRYALDGNDPNGFVGVMWSIAGIHDQGWKERNVFGKIRFMNYAGCKRKFDVRKFVAKYSDAKKAKPLFND